MMGIANGRHGGERRSRVVRRNSPGKVILAVPVARRQLPDPGRSNVTRSILPRLPGQIFGRSVFPAIFESKPNDDETIQSLLADWKKRPGISAVYDILDYRQKKC